MPRDAARRAAVAMLRARGERRVYDAPLPDDALPTTPTARTTTRRCHASCLRYCVMFLRRATAAYSRRRRRHLHRSYVYDEAASRKQRDAGERCRGEMSSAHSEPVARQRRSEKEGIFRVTPDSVSEIQIRARPRESRDDRVICGGHAGKRDADIITTSIEYRYVTIIFHHVVTRTIWRR